MAIGNTLHAWPMSRYVNGKDNILVLDSWNVVHVREAGVGEPTERERAGGE